MRKALLTLLFLALPACAFAQVQDVPFFSAKRMVLSVGVQEKFVFSPEATQVMEVGPILGYRLTKNLSLNTQWFGPVGKDVTYPDDIYGLVALRWRVWDGAK